MSARGFSVHQRARKAEIALGELSLSVTTQADKKRIDRIQAGLRALDEEQANVKTAIDDLLAALDSGYTQVEVIEDLRVMSKKWRAGR